MIDRAYFSHYRAVRAWFTAAGTVGTAILLGYLIVWARL